MIYKVITRMPVLWNHQAYGQDQCSAWGQTCKSCGKQNHFTKRCKQDKLKHKTHWVPVGTEDSSCNTNYINGVTVKPGSNTNMAVIPSMNTNIKVDLSWICLTLCYFKCLLVSKTKIFKFAHNP